LGPEKSAGMGDLSGGGQDGEARGVPDSTVRFNPGGERP
jgi:hypothetical protein